MHAEWLSHILIFLAAAVIAVPLFQRLGLGAILGYLVAGCVIGPQGLGLIGEVEQVRELSEFGVVLMLFVIGLELVPARLWQLRGQVFGWGSAQMLVTGIVLASILWLMNLSLAGAIIAGVGFAMSSTAMALQIMAERNEMTSPQGRLAFAILLLQDLAVIPLLALLPFLAPEAAANDHSGPGAIKVIAVLAAVLIGGRYLLRPALARIAEARSRELFTASSLLLVLGIAVLMSSIGLSMALGAFVAGVLLADSEFRHELESDIEPFKGLLLGLFFISIGMGLDLALLVKAWWAIGLAVLGLMLIKGVVLFLLGKWSGLTSRGARALALTLGQGGEFAFVLLTLAVGHQLLSNEESAVLNLIVGLSMMATPLLRYANERWLEPRLAARVPALTHEPLPEEAVPVVIAGFGRFSQIVARVLQTQNIPFTAMDRDSSHIQFVGRFGNKVYYGDVSRLDLLQTAQVGKARLFVLGIGDIESSLRTAQLLREQFPEVKIFARAVNRNHAYKLINLGVHYVIRETFNSSIELAERALLELGLTDSAASDTVRIFREHDEKLVREGAAHAGDVAKLSEIAQRGRAELESLFAKDKA